jgi:hypothetical protein
MHEVLHESFYWALHSYQVSASVLSPNPKENFDILFLCTFKLPRSTPIPQFWESSTMNCEFGQTILPFFHESQCQIEFALEQRIYTSTSTYHTIHTTNSIQFDCKCVSDCEMEKKRHGAHEQGRGESTDRWGGRERESQGGEAEEVDGGLGHDGGELLEADDAVAVGVGLAHHVGELGVADGVAQPRHGPRELGGGDESVAVAVEGAEGLGELRLVDGHGGAAGPQEQRREGGGELVELHGAVAVGVHGGDERVDLVPGGGAEAQGAEQRRELQHGEAPVAVEVEAEEELAELAQLLVAEPRAPAGRGGRGGVPALAGAGAVEGHGRRALGAGAGGGHGVVLLGGRAAFSGAVFGGGAEALHAVACLASRMDMIAPPRSLVGVPLGGAVLTTRPVQLLFVCCSVSAQLWGALKLDGFLPPCGKRGVSKPRGRSGTLICLALNCVGKEIGYVFPP